MGGRIIGILKLLPILLSIFLQGNPAVVLHRSLQRIKFLRHVHGQVVQLSSIFLQMVELKVFHVLRNDFPMVFNVSGRLFIREMYRAAEIGFLPFE